MRITRGWALYWTVQTAFTARAMDTVNAYWERLWAYYPCPHEPRLHLAIHYLAGYLFPERHTAEWREQAVQFAHQQGDPLLLLDAIDALLEPLYFRGEYERARAYLREAETLARQLGSQTRLLPMLYTRAYIDIQQGALDSAESLIAELYALDAQLGRHAESIQWLHGMLYRHQGRYADALRLALELTAQHEMAQRPHEAASAWDLAATVALEMGDLTAARRYAEHALAQRARQDDAYRLHYSRHHLLRRSRHDRARRRSHQRLARLPALLGIARPAAMAREHALLPCRRACNCRRDRPRPRRPRRRHPPQRSDGTPNRP
jgi:tetratricopeptide (TPR) repeat protein